MIEIKLDKAALDAAQKALKTAPKKVRQALVAAENRTLTAVQKDISREVTSKYLIKARAVKGTLTKTRATAASLEASVVSEGQSIYLGRFKVAKYNRRRRLWMQVKKNGRKHYVPGLFRSTPSKLPMHRFSRKRSDVEKPFGPSVPQMIGNEAVLNKITAKAEENLNKRFMHELSWRLSK